MNDLSVDELAQKILQLSPKDDSLREKLRLLTLEISRIEVFSQFSLEDIAYIQKESGRFVQFFVGSPSAFRDKEIPEEIIYIASDNSLNYFIAFNDKETSYDKLVEMKITHSLQDLKTFYDTAAKELTAIDLQLKALAKYNTLLHLHLIEKLNQHHLYNVHSYVKDEMDGVLFAIEGWIPLHEINEVERLVEKQHIHMEEVAIEPNDVIPTFLKNEGSARLGEDLVDIYDTPSPTDQDPSNWVLWSFVLFFAFIIGDAGYGLLYLLAALFLRFKYPSLTGIKKRFLNLFTILSIGCIVWGTLMTSFFGMQIDPHHPIRKVSLISWLVDQKATYLMKHDNAEYRSFIVKYPELANAKTPHEFATYDVPDNGAVVYNRFKR